VNLTHSLRRQGEHINKTRKNKGKIEEKKMVSVGQPSSPSSSSSSAAIGEEQKENC
jgi:hypothetical protein